MFFLSSVVTVNVPATWEVQPSTAGTAWVKLLMLPSANQELHLDILLFKPNVYKSGL